MPLYCNAAKVNYSSAISTCAKGVGKYSYGVENALTLKVCWVQMAGCQAAKEESMLTQRQNTPERPQTTNTTWKGVICSLCSSEKVWMWKVIFPSKHSFCPWWCNRPGTMSGCEVTAPWRVCSLLTLHQHISLSRRQCKHQSMCSVLPRDNNTNNIREEHVQAQSLLGECLLLNNSTLPAYTATQDLHWAEENTNKILQPHSSSGIM